MTMRCNRCNSVLEDWELETARSYERHSEVDTRQYETFQYYVCPYCGSADIEEVYDRCSEDTEQDALV